MIYSIDRNFTIKLIENESLAKYKGQSINNVVWDAEYDAHYHEDNYDDCTNCDLSLESSKYHEDIDEIMESEAVTNIEDGLCDFITDSVYHGRLKVSDDMVLLVEFTDWKTGIPSYSYRVIAETMV